MQVNTIFSELLKLIPRYEFDRIVAHYNGNRYTKSFTGQQEFIALLYAQIRGKDSLREIETALKMQSNKWYHIGYKGVGKSAFAEAMNKRSSKIYEDLFNALLVRCKSLSSRHKFRFKNKLYNLDSTLIELCLSIFPWAKYRKRKGALKVHCLTEQRDSTLPSFIEMSDGKKSDVKTAKNSYGITSSLLPDSIVAFDRGYIDFEWMNSLNRKGIYFVTRSKRNMCYEVVEEYRIYTNKDIEGVVLIELANSNSKKAYPEKMRLVSYRDKDSGKLYEYITNNMTLSAKTIADVYKNRWQIELFFKWLKQNLQIKSFLGTSPNAVMTQVWVAMCFYLLLYYIKYQTKFSRTLTELALMIGEVLMDKIHLIDILSLNKFSVAKAREPSMQILLF
jgi:hypothetical protein